MNFILNEFQLLPLLSTEQKIKLFILILNFKFQILPPKKILESFERTANGYVNDRLLKTYHQSGKSEKYFLNLKWFLTTTRIRLRHIQTQTLLNHIFLSF